MVTARKTIAAVVVAGGLGERAAAGEAALPKQYRPLGGLPVLRRVIDALLDLEAIGIVVPVINAAHAELYHGLAIDHPRVAAPIAGGPHRQASVLAGLRALEPSRPDFVLIQDAARPFVDRRMIEGVIGALADHDAALPAIAVTDTIKRSTDGLTVTATEDRSTLFAAQTPQGFRFASILAAHTQAAALPRTFTDDAAIAEWAGLSVALTAGSPHNLKLTVADDFARAERMIRGDLAMETRIGTGFDVHPFAPGDHVTLGGVAIPHTHALEGHSDADAALHALADAVYGAIGENDIGTHFPPADAQWRAAPSRIFLEHAAGLVAARKGRIVNLDLTIVCEAPRIAPHVAAMRDLIAAACGIEPSRVAIKATTSERLGFTGRREGVVAMASASVELPR